MAISFADDAIGVLFSELVKVVKDMANNNANFKSNCKRLEKMLSRLTPVVDEIRYADGELDRSNEEAAKLTDLVRRGLSLVERCKKVHWWNVSAKNSCRTKLTDYEDKLSFFFGLDLQAQISRDSRLSLVSLRRMDAKLDRIGTTGSVVKTNGLVGCCEIPGVPNFLVGLEEPLQELKMQLLKDGVRVLVITAPGGCGKTTLAKALCNDTEIRGTYRENIFFVTVSKAADPKVIIKTIFEHNNYPVPGFSTDGDAINQLECMLKQIGQNHILLVLDDVWSGLESFIDDLICQIKEITVLITSRFVFPRFDYTYKLQLLKEQDAMALFYNSAFQEDGDSSIPNDLVNEIVRRCRRFPLALRVVGRSLRKQPAVIWERMLKHYSETESIVGSDPKLLTWLQSSLNTLDHIKEKCYLDVASFPEDKRIPAMALIDMWVELYNLDEEGQTAFANLIELSMRSLVSLVNARKEASVDSPVSLCDGCRNEDFVTQHDLLRELAIHQSGQKPIQERERLIMEIRGNDVPMWWAEQREHPIHARLVSISTDETFSSNWCDLQLPMAEVVVLNIQGQNYTLPQFMEKMDQLKALIIMCCGFCSARISNFPLLGYLSSLRRVRLEHVCISSIGNSIMQLRNLRKLSFIMCEIGDSFGDCTIQTPGMLPNLVEIVIDHCNDLVEFPPWLCNIYCLRKLSIINCHEMVAIPEGLGKLENLEMLDLHACTKLFELPESLGRLHKLVFLDVSDCISMNRLPRRMGELCGLEELHMRGCRGLYELSLSIESLNQLKTVTCDEEIGYLWDNYKYHLPNLHIKVVKEDANLNWLDMKW